MPAKKTFTLMVLAVVVAAIAFGCGNDDTATAPDNSGTWQPLELADYDYHVRKIAPPEYTAPVTAPATVDPMWTATYLPKVFSTNEPMSLYSNLDTFQSLLTELESYLLINDDGDIAVDSSAGGAVGDYLQVFNLSEPTAIPVDANMDALFGASLTVEKLVRLNWVDLAGRTCVEDIAFTLNDTEQTVAVFSRHEESGTVTTTSMYYARFVLADSSVAMKGMTYKDYGDDTSARWTYSISSVDDSQFSYRMNWYADSSEQVPQSMLGCILGGGDRNVEFALEYREYKPADSAEYVDELSSEQVFGPDFSEGTGLITAYHEFVAEDLWLDYDDQALAPLTSPWDAIE